jgi:hypothetical protein
MKRVSVAAQRLASFRMSICGNAKRNTEELIGSRVSESPEAVPKVRKMGIPLRNYLYIVCKLTERITYLQIYSEKGGNPPQEESGCSCDVGDNTCEVSNKFRAR